MTPSYAVRRGKNAIVERVASAEVGPTKACTGLTLEADLEVAI